MPQILKVRQESVCWTAPESCCLLCTETTVSLDVICYRDNSQSERHADGTRTTWFTWQRPWKAAGATIATAAISAAPS